MNMDIPKLDTVDARCQLSFAHFQEGAHRGFKDTNGCPPQHDFVIPDS